MAYAVQLSAANGNGSYTWSVTSGSLPAGLSLSASGLISGTPTTSGTSAFTVQAADGVNTAGESVLTLNARAILVSPGFLSTVKLNTEFSTTLSATGGTGPYTWAVSSGSLPTGIAIENSTGVLSGTPTAAGANSFTIRATDADGFFGERAYQLNIINGTPTALTTASCVSGYNGSAYSQTLSATGGDGSLAWSISSGALPGGLSLDTSTGSITGTATAADTFVFTVTVVDTTDILNYDSTEYSITIYEVVGVNNTALASIGANRALDEALAATGGSGMYTWSLVSGALPPDVSLSPTGVLSGYPGKPGSYSFTVRATDSGNSANFGEQTLSLIVNSFTWTFMVYLTADNNLESNAFDDLNEMEAADLRGTGIKLIVLMDGNGGYYSGAGAFSNTRLFDVRYDAAGDSATTGIVSQRLTSSTVGVSSTGTEELNMGEPATARNFITFCKNDYPAQNYSLIFWNHGSGWRSTTSAAKTASIPGSPIPSPIIITNDFVPKTDAAPTGTYKAICEDLTNEDILYTQEIGTVLDGMGIDVVCMDLCYGAMMEIAYEIRNHAKFLVTSEEVTPGDGYEYDSLFNAFKATGMSVDNWLSSVVNQFGVRYSATAGTTQSAIDLSLIDDVMTALNTFSSTLYSACTTSAIRNTVAGTIFNYTEDYFSVPGDLNVDMYDMAYQVKTLTDYADAAATALMTAVDNAVVHEWHHNTNNPRSHGLALHFVGLDDAGDIDGHSTAYGQDWTGAYPLSFVQNSSWVPDFTNKDGLLYRFFYETL